jgi:Kef-type K+ transport system membrane component KefB
LTVVAQFGLIFFMFLIGLELDLTLVARSGRVAVLVSHVSIVFPFVLGLVASLVVYPLLGNGDFVGFALFLGAALAITAFPVLARILTDTGLHRTRVGTLAITCAAIDDVTAWCLLAIVVAVVKSSGALDVVATGSHWCSWPG